MLRFSLKKKLENKRRRKIMSSSNVDSLLSELDGILGDECGEDRSYDSRTKKKKNSYGEDGDIDSLLEETDFSFSSKTDFSSKTKKTSSRASSSISRKKASTSLICLNCDFEVLKFDRMRWSVSSNYLFFRNYVPDTSLLSEKLEKSERNVSYCCQCAWQTVSRYDKSISSERSGTADGKSVRWVGSSEGESWKRLI